MAWDHLDIDKPHLAYMILGGFTSLFMLCSLFVKEKLYIGEATVATICGVIFGPHAANLFDPISWGNVDKITLECSRIVLVVQCFAVGVELPKSYMERHWRSVALLLVPVMTWGWLMTSLFIWWMVPALSWLESLIIAACVTATDPVLASSVVGKGKFAKRVPKHLRDLLSAESGCNDGMAFPFIYLSLYILAYQPHADKVALHWFCVTLLYECILGAFVGFMIGYAGRHAIKLAERRGLIDRESFLVFYFVLALFAAGTGSLLGMDDLLMGFSAGVGFSNDGWFTEKTEESHVSNVIDLLLNLAYFVYFGAIIPWQEFHAPEFGLPAWRLVVIALLVIFFRRIPIMLILKPFIPDVKTWREALFAGHFGPIGVGAIFACILTRAELETHTTQPLDDLPPKGSHNYLIIQLIWPITTFLVISSILVHGSSIAVFTLGKRINTLTITMSYTTANDEGPSWMNRLPRIQSQSKASLTLRKDSFNSSSEGLPQIPPGTLGPIGIPGNLLKRQKEGDQSLPGSRASSRKPTRRKKMGAGGPISQSAIVPQRRIEPMATDENVDIEMGVKQPRERVAGDEDPEIGPGSERDEPSREPEIEVYQEGDKMIIEDEEGNVLETSDISHLSPEQREHEILAQHKRIRSDPAGYFAKGKRHPHERMEGEDIQKAIHEDIAHPMRELKKRIPWLRGMRKTPPTAEEMSSQKTQKKRTRRSARAYQFANTIIVEDEDGEVIKNYTIPAHKSTKKEDPEGQTSPTIDDEPLKRRLSRMGTWIGRDDGKDGEAKPQDGEASDDERLRFTVLQKAGRARHHLGGRRMTKEDFIKEIQQLDPKARMEIYDEDIPGQLDEPPEEASRGRGRQPGDRKSPIVSTSDGYPFPESGETESSHDIASALAQYPGPEVSTAESHRGRSGGDSPPSPSSHAHRRRDSEDDGTRRIPPAELRQLAGLPPAQPSSVAPQVDPDTGETPAERKRRLAALGQLPAGDDGKGTGEDRGRRTSDEAQSDSEDDGLPRPVKGKVSFADGTRPAKTNQSAMAVQPSQSSLRPGNGNGEGSENHDGNGNGNKASRHGRISWGGERGRTR